jgi:D-alanyl-D-alanine carboxypeptidase (penicillin-binding protein 5/6)
MNNRILIQLLITLAASGLSRPTFAARAPIETVSADPYASALVMDAATGKVLFEENADVVLFPASMVKLMTMLLITERIESGQLKLTDHIRVTEEAERMGGAQVYLATGESFTLEEMLYALSIKSANDVAVALAIHLAGSKDGLVKMMNDRAAELGLASTKFASVHGLPPDVGQEPDRTTARDMAQLSLEILKHPMVLQYTSAKEKWFRNDTFEMLTHNRLLHNVDGCDGLKTGYFKAAGFSVAATAQRQGRRVIAVVMGSTVRQTRDDKAADLLNQGFALLPELPALPIAPPPPPAAPPQEVKATSASAPEVTTLATEQSETHPLLADTEQNEEPQQEKKSFPWLIVVLVPMVLGGAIMLLRHKRII